MDTRDKIIDCEHAAALAAQLRQQGASLRAVTGYFDVLVAEHVRRLRQIADGSAKLFLVVLDPPAPLLAARARAEMIAALAMVDYVVPAGERAAEGLLSQFAASEIVREESADLLRAERLSQHVQRRHQQ
jgi:bifunctional ADP-heptose synthase (sugar kinase/adenylyltransferase)